MGVNLPGFSFPPPPDPARMEAVDGESRYTPNPQFRMWLAQMYNWTTKLGNNANGSITANAFTAGTSPNWVNIDSNGIWGGGTTFANANFSVSMTGAVKAVSGSIAGWTIGSTTLSKNSAILDSAGQLILGTSNDVIYLSATDSTYRLWVGNAAAASAKFTVTKGGDVAIGGGGTFQTTGYVRATGGIAGAFSTAAIVGDPAAANVGGGSFTASGTGAAIVGYILSGGTNSAAVLNATNSNTFAVQIIGNTSAAALAISAGVGQPAISTVGTITSGQITANLTGTASGNLVNGGALGTPASGNLANCSFPTLNQNTSGYSAKIHTTNDYSFTGANIASGASTATFSGFLPTGSSGSTNQWLELIIDTTHFWIPFWVK